MGDPAVGVADQIDSGVGQDAGQGLRCRDDGGDVSEDMGVAGEEFGIFEGPFDLLVDGVERHLVVEVGQEFLQNHHHVGVAVAGSPFSGKEGNYL